MNGLVSNRHADVSVIIPAFNEEMFIERCLRSLLSQSATDICFNIIVVDDASTDRTANLVSKHFPDVILERNDVNRGLPASLNRGIEATSSQFIVRVDADDFVDSKFLELLYFTMISNPQFEAVSCDYYLVAEDGTRIQKMVSHEAPIGCGIIFRRDIMLNLGLFDERFRIREEEDLMIRFINAGYKLLRLPLPLYRYRKHGNSLTTNKQAMQNYQELLSNKHQC